MGKVLKQISQGGQNKVIGQKEDKDLEYTLNNDLNVPKWLSTVFALAFFA